MNRIKKSFSREQGFTLVEIIVVLVILAILAAFTIPTMLGFVADAKGKAYIAEAREVYVAAQAVATEYSGTTAMTDGNNISGVGDAHSNGIAASISSFEVQYRYLNFKATDKVDANGFRWYDTPYVKASHQMYQYLSADLPIKSYTDSSISRINLLNTVDGSADLTPYGHRAAWVVTVGDSGGTTDSASRTSKVTKVVYLRDGYRVTIEGNNATVEKYVIISQNENAEPDNASPGIKK